MLPYASLYAKYEVHSSDQKDNLPSLIDHSWMGKTNITKQTYKYIYGYKLW